MKKEPMKGLHKLQHDCAEIHFYFPGPMKHSSKKNKYSVYLLHARTEISKAHDIQLKSTVSPALRVFIEKSQ